MSHPTSFSIVLSKILHAATPDTIELEPELEPAIADERLLAVLQGQGQLTGEERCIMLQSPLTRERFLRLYQREQVKVQQQWRQEGIQPDIIEALAAADQPRPQQIERTQYRLNLIPIDPAGEEWKILLTIKPEFRQASPLGFRLVDSGQRTWVAGFPDKDGEIVGYWSYEDSLWERFHQYRLELVPQ